MTTSVRAIRGAITVDDNQPHLILEATRLLLQKIVEENDIEVEDIISVIFSLTQDLNAEFPAVAARQMGWNQVPLFCCQEINVPNALNRCVRVLMHCNSSRPKKDIKPVYLREAARLREDL